MSFKYQHSNETYDVEIAQDNRQFSVSYLANFYRSKQKIFTIKFICEEDDAYYPQIMDQRPENIKKQIINGLLNGRCDSLLSSARELSATIARNKNGNIPVILGKLESVI